ncbi:uncharacterized protein LOC112556365 [Pomacea canaliculata]|uniref:uncharacterized protein LOC112556365 n=1 Tax=Pomacea canaliculata TaxID=400727 RepID=UPI000D72F692|nr:uncharacterized protein LOC112556365 [Pomacea canaliculata]
MNMLWWSLILVANMLPRVFCVQESVDTSKGDQQTSGLELMAASIRQLAELSEKLEKRLELVENMDKRLELFDKFEKRFELVQKMEEKLELIEKRFNEQDKINQQLKSSLETILKAVEDGTTGKHSESGYVEKRSDDAGTWEPVVAQVTQRLNLAEANIQALRNLATAEQQARGSVYTRWGSSQCPSSATTVYSGYVGGSWYGHSGGASNYLCLPPDPTFTNHTVPRYPHALLYGAEYETCDEPECDLNPTCAVCHMWRESSMMLPGRNTCYSGWTLEYSGYLMTTYYNQPAGTEYICVDSSLGSVPGTKADDNGAVLYYTIYECGSLPCPPYINEKVAVCAVCSR